MSCQSAWTTRVSVALIGHTCEVLLLLACPLLRSKPDISVSVRMSRAGASHLDERSEWADGTGTGLRT
jgi:hypothetical protein